MFGFRPQLTLVVSNKVEEFYRLTVFFFVISYSFAATKLDSKHVALDCADVMHLDFPERRRPIPRMTLTNNLKPPNKSQVVFINPAAFDKNNHWSEI